jgi:hypothetical protein
LVPLKVNFIAKFLNDFCMNGFVKSLFKPSFLTFKSSFIQFRIIPLP